MTHLFKFSLWPHIRTYLCSHRWSEAQWWPSCLLTSQTLFDQHNTELCVKRRRGCEVIIRTKSWRLSRRRCSWEADKGARRSPAPRNPISPCLSSRFEKLKIFSFFSIKSFLPCIRLGGDFARPDSAPVRATISLSCDKQRAQLPALPGHVSRFCVYSVWDRCSRDW